MTRKEATDLARLQHKANEGFPLSKPERKRLAKLLKGK